MNKDENSMSLEDAHQKLCDLLSEYFLAIGIGDKKLFVYLMEESKSLKNKIPEEVGGWPVEVVRLDGIRPA